MCVVLIKRHNLFKVLNKIPENDKFSINVTVARGFVPLSNGKIGGKSAMLYFIPPVILAILRCPSHEGMAALRSRGVCHIWKEH